MDHVLEAILPHYEATLAWFVKEQQTGQYKKLSENPYYMEIKVLLDAMNVRLSPSTVVLYKIYAKSHYKPYFKDLKLSQLNEIHIRRFMAEKLKELSLTTVRKLMFVLNKILRDVLKDKNPAKDVEPPSKDEFSPHVLTDGEFSQIHDVVRGTRDEQIILLAAWCGLRRGGIFALKWNDIDWEKCLHCSALMKVSA